MSSSSDYLIFSNALIFLSLLLLALIIEGALHKLKIWWLPSSGATLILGVVVGLVINVAGDSNERGIVGFNSQIFFFVLLPPIIFESGFALKRKHFFENFGSILLFAFIGTVFNVFVFGELIYIISSAGITDMPQPSLLESLLYGSVLGATDPIGTLALLSSPAFKTPPTLYSLIFGESVLNDAVAIVLYATFNDLMPSSDSDASQSSSSSSSFTAGTLFEALGLFVGISIGSLVMGVAVSLLCCFFFKRMELRRSQPSYEFLIMTLFAYFSYFLAEIAQLSGIMSLFFAAITLAHYNYYNLSDAAKEISRSTFSALAHGCETFVYLFVGTSFAFSLSLKSSDSSSSSQLSWSLPLIGFTLLALLVSRAFNIFPLAFLSNKFRRQKITMPMQIFMWFGGMRGAVAFALALSFPGAYSGYVITSTLAIVVCTTLLCGALTVPVLRLTGLIEIETQQVDSLPLTQQQTRIRMQIDPKVPIAEPQESVHLQAVSDRPTEQFSSSPASFCSFLSSSQTSDRFVRRLRKRWMQFDKTIMARYFGGEYANFFTSPTSLVRDRHRLQSNARTDLLKISILSADAQDEHRAAHDCIDHVKQSDELSTHVDEKERPFALIRSTSERKLLHVERIAVSPVLIATSTNSGATNDTVAAEDKLKLPELSSVMSMTATDIPALGDEQLTIYTAEQGGLRRTIILPSTSTGIAGKDEASSWWMNDEPAEWRRGSGDAIDEADEEYTPTTSSSDAPNIGDGGVNRKVEEEEPEIQLTIHPARKTRDFGVQPNQVESEKNDDKATGFSDLFQQSPAETQLALEPTKPAASGVMESNAGSTIASTTVPSADCNTTTAVITTRLDATDVALPGTAVVATNFSEAVLSCAESAHLDETLNVRAHVSDPVKQCSDDIGHGDCDDSLQSTAVRWGVHPTPRPMMLQPSIVRSEKTSRESQHEQSCSEQRVLIWAELEE